MSRVFSSASSEAIRFSSFAEISAYPFSIILWFKAYQTNIYGDVLNYCSAVNNEQYIRVLLFNNGTFWASIRNGGVEPSIAGGSYSANTWHCVGITYSAANNRELWVDGTSIGTSTTSINFPPINRFSLGRLDRPSPANAFNGETGWCAHWNTSLTDADHKTLAKGVSPLLIKPNSLKVFVPCGNLNGETDLDLITGTTLTEVGTPTWSDDSPTGLIYPSRQIIGVSQGIITPPPQYNQRQILLKNKMSIQNSRLLIGK
jgi:hypothetical protein